MRNVKNATPNISHKALTRVFKPNPKCNYRYDYERIFKDIARGHLPKLETYRTLILNDLWFNVRFVWMADADPEFVERFVNHPWVVDRCNEIQDGPATRTLELYAREHFKSTIITKAESVWKLLRNPEERIGIFSYVRPVAKTFLRAIMALLETNQLLKACFPDILYDNPRQEARKWSEDDGIIVKRKGNYNESSIEAWGLIEGMPTGRHFTHRVYDDIVTEDMVDSPELDQMFSKILRKFDSSQNLGTFNGTYRVIGTHYHYQDPLMTLRNRKDINGTPLYHVRVYPATDDGTPTGKPVLLPQERLDDLRAADPYVFACQQLLDPVPQGDARLNPDMLNDCMSYEVPKSCLKFILIDQAGDNPNKNTKHDSWAVLLVGVEPELDDIGTSRVFILDGFVEPMGETEAIEGIVRLYCRSGIIQAVGVEQVGLSATHKHVQQALMQKKRYISEDDKSLYLLKPSKRNKKKRILSALEWPLNNGKIYIVKDRLSMAVQERIKTEMRTFPYGHDDALDALSYLYDILHDDEFMFNVGTYSMTPLDRPNLGVI